MRGLRISQSITDRQDASLGLYFKDVSRIPLLSPEEEVELGKRSIKGDQQAIDKLVTANLRFAISVAKQYQGKGMPLVDLVQAANEGLISGAKKYDPEKGFRFISFAVWWIRQSVVKALLSQGKTIRIPMSQLSCINKITKTAEKFEQENGREPSIIELEDATNLSKEKINSSMASISKSVSLDAPFKDEDVGSLIDVIPNNTTDPTDYSLNNRDISERIEQILETLNPREADIIRMSFGLGVDAMPNEKIAKYFGIGGERVRQLQKGALKYLKTHYAKELSELL